MENKVKSIKDLKQIPRIGISLATDLWKIGVTSFVDFKGKDAYSLFDLSNIFAGTVQDRCVLCVFKCVIYYADTPKEEHETEKLKWWNWKDN